MILGQVVHRVAGGVFGGLAASPCNLIDEAPDGFGQAMWELITVPPLPMERRLKGGLDQQQAGLTLSGSSVDC